MHCSYCSQGNLNETRHYNIENVKQRFIPTYFHSQIFGATQPIPSKVRCTPTFHSSALRVDNYGHNCKCQKKVQPVRKANQGLDGKKITRGGDFSNARGKSCYNSRVKWYDSDKNQVFNHIQNTYDYSKQRKFADLASSSVFDGYTYEPRYVQSKLCQCESCNCENCKCGKQNNGDCGCSSPKKVQAQQKGQCNNCNCVNCECGKNKTKNGHSCCDNSPKKIKYQQAQAQACKNCKFTTCNCQNCQCGNKQEDQKKGNKCNVCQCSNCTCVDCKCKAGSCGCGTAAVNQPVEKEQKTVINGKKLQRNEQITFGKRGENKIQKVSIPQKRTIKEKPTFTVIRHKK